VTLVSTDVFDCSAFDIASGRFSVATMRGLHRLHVGIPLAFSMEIFSAQRPQEWSFELRSSSSFSRGSSSPQPVWAEFTAFGPIGAFVSSFRRDIPQTGGWVGFLVKLRENHVIGRPMLLGARITQSVIGPPTDR